MVMTEEEHLTKLFGVKYRDYCSKVPRYIAITGIKKGKALT
jgi:protein-S-isoprenylcysteine O-methyltransferase Ste14